METNLQEAIQEKPTEQAQSTPPVKEPDLVTRVSQFKKEEPKTDAPAQEEKFDFKELEAEAEKNPILMKAYKSLQSGFNKKFQEVADLRKSLEKQKEPSNWTPEKVQALLNDPAFVQSAQSLAQPQNQSGLTEEEFSTLSDREKQKLTQMEQELNLLKNETQKSQYQAMKIKQDTEIAQKYANYNPEAVDIVTAELLENKRIATREDLWKVLDYESAIQRAYKMGLEDRNLNQQEKVNSSSFDSGVQAVNINDSPPPEKGESSGNYFKRIALKVLADPAMQKTRR